jgi:hypothetical protein
MPGLSCRASERQSHRCCRSWAIDQRRSVLLHAKKGGAAASTEDVDLEKVAKQAEKDAVRNVLTSGCQWAMPRMRAQYAVRVVQRIDPHALEKP